jgi:Protein of unknown function (DUF3108)
VRQFFSKYHLIGTCCIVLVSINFSQSNCVAENTAYSPGEELNYKVIYNWGMIWLESGKATFRVGSAKIKNRTLYVFNGSGSTYPNYDWFYKVKDVFEAYVDSATLKPLIVNASIWEGSKKEKHNYVFNFQTKKAYTNITRGKNPAKLDTVKTTECTIDVTTAIYYARNIDYSNCKKNDTVGLSLLIDGKVYPIYIRYLGKEKYNAGSLGYFNCIKFSPLLVEGSIFKGGEGMKVWVTDDNNKIPLYIETPIVVGSIKVKLVSYKGLRNPEDAKVK